MWCDDGSTDPLCVWPLEVRMADNVRLLDVPVVATVDGEVQPSKFAILFGPDLFDCA